ncbi:hypothetical protein NMG60_11017073 [Bertholletia excelsa]
MKDSIQHKAFSVHKHTRTSKRAKEIANSNRSQELHPSCCQFRKHQRILNLPMNIRTSFCSGQNDSCWVEKLSRNTMTFESVSVWNLIFCGTLRREASGG